jgi:transglutaminase-like putative cysteine protease
VSEPGTTAAGFPTPTALSAYRHDLAQMAHVLHTAAVPVHPLGTSLLLAVLAAWLTGAIAYLCATRFAGSLAALVAPLTLFVTVSALGRGSQGPTTLMFGAGVAVFLLAQQRGALTDRRARFHAGPSRVALPIAGAVVATTVALLAALVAGPTLPGARSDPLIDYRRLGGAARGAGSLVVVTPLVDIRDRLDASPAQELFTVKTNRPTYWRIAGLDEFDGNVWLIAPGTDSAPVSALHSSPPSTGHVVDIDAQFDTSSLAGPWVPVPYQPRSVDLHGASVLPGSDTVIVKTEGAINATYDVVAKVPAPTPAEVAAAKVATDAAARADLALPDDFPDRVKILANSVTLDATTPYEKALALQDFLRSKPFRYSLDVPKGRSDSALVDFLFNTHAGFCEQFSSAFAAMARAIGLPTRVAVGFTPGQLDSSGDEYHVTTQDAHAWPEVDFAGLGWIRFEPTPTRFDPTPGDYTTTGHDAPSTTAPATTAAPSTTAPSTGPGATGTRNPELQLEKNLNGAGGSSGSGHATGAAALRFLLAVLGLLVALALAFVGSVIGSKSLRRFRRRRRATARAQVIGAWDEALERLAESGIHRRPATTPVEFAMREAPAGGAGGAGPPLLALAHLTTNALYSPDEPRAEDADEAWRQLLVLEHELRANAALRARVRRRLDPRVLRGSLPGDTEVDDGVTDDALVIVSI